MSPCSLASPTYGDRRADDGRSIISTPTIYALSMAVYCTAWTFYGSVGRAVETGVGFLPTYIGPTLVAVLGLTLLEKDHSHWQGPPYYLHRRLHYLADTAKAPYSAAS
jgi:hypothetical protein